MRAKTEQHDSDTCIFSHDALAKQLVDAELRLGYAIVRFYVTEFGALAKEPTDVTKEFYFLAAGGTLRDENMNIVLYSAKNDLYKGLGKVRR